MIEVLEISYYNLPKNGEIVAGDTFLKDKTEGGKIIATLADGLGSGVKANVLSQITAAMAQRYMKSDVDTVRMAQTIMETLPVCSIRKISYSTLTSICIDVNGSTKIIEYDNPELLWIRNNSFKTVVRKPLKIKTSHARNKISHSSIELEVGDRLVFFSDGVSQAGIGSNLHPLGWGMDNIRGTILSKISINSKISASDLSKQIVDEALENDEGLAKDDITCAVVYYRIARKTLLVTGPPSNESLDVKIVDKYKNFKGERIISGGTTSKIISKGISEQLTVDLNDIYSDVPPSAKMKSASLVTEGMLTINKVIKLLKDDGLRKLKCNDAAYKMMITLLNSDIIYMMVGTAINPAHQNPDMPIEMGLRRMSVNKLAKVLKDKYLKEVQIEYI